jgi:hypothetical protein
MRALIFSLLVLTAACATARAEPAASFDSLVGDWAGQGQFQGALSQVSARFEPLFDGAAWALDIDIRFSPPARPPMRFQGRGNYVLREGTPVGGTWVDSFANAYEISPRFEAGALVVDWGENGVTGRSLYRRLPNGNLRIEDMIQAADGQWRTFATAELQRTG